MAMVMAMSVRVSISLVQMIYPIRYRYGTFVAMTTALVGMGKG